MKGLSKILKPENVKEHLNAHHASYKKSNSIFCRMQKCIHSCNSNLGYLVLDMEQDVRNRKGDEMRCQESTVVQQINH